MDRSIAPKVELPKEFDFLKAKKLTLQNDIPVYYIDGSSQEVVKLELIFDAGYRLQDTPLQALAANKLLIEGTDSKTSLEISELFESKGAFLDTSMHADYSSVNIHCLKRHLGELLMLLLDIVQNASFPEGEIFNFRENKKQMFLINNEKVSFLTKNQFIASLFGEGHPYDNSIKIDDFDKIDRKSILHFYEKNYRSSSFSVLLSGNVDDQSISDVSRIIESYEFSPFKKGKYTQSDVSKGKHSFIDKPQASQSSIRLGVPTISKNHSDFPALFFASTVLGGFFGSRLMSNLREDKGYTYGISSGITCFQNTSYFSVVTEVGVEHTQSSLEEIEKELNRMMKEEISSKELELVKNYLMGVFMRNFDGPFAAMDRFKSIHVLGLDYSYYTNLIKSTKNMTADKLLEVSSKYLKFEQLKQIIAGKLS